MLQVYLTTEIEMDKIKEIEREEAVASMQLPDRIERDYTDLAQAGTLLQWKKGPRCYSIVFNKQVVGVIELCAEEGEQSVYYAGWNLSTEFWNKGIMTSALKVLFSELFRETNAAMVMAECFLDNKACLRVMEKVGFKRFEPSVQERLQRQMELNTFRILGSFVLTKRHFQN